MSLRIITMPIQSQGLITKDNVSIDVSAVAYYRMSTIAELGAFLARETKAAGDPAVTPNLPTISTNGEPAPS